MTREREEEEQKALRAVIESKAKPASKTLIRVDSEAADDFSNAAEKFAGKP